MDCIRVGFYYSIKVTSEYLVYEPRKSFVIYQLLKSYITDKIKTKITLRLKIKYDHISIAIRSAHIWVEIRHTLL